jgi:hypothetical protein
MYVVVGTYERFLLGYSVDLAAAVHSPAVHLQLLQPAG